MTARTATATAISENYQDGKAAAAALSDEGKAYLRGETDSIFARNACLVLGLVDGSNRITPLGCAARYFVQNS